MEKLRPLERRIVAMRDDGLDVAEIGERIKRSPDHVERMLGWIEIPRSRAPRRTKDALERRVLEMRSAGEDHATIAEKFDRGEKYIRQVEGLAHYRLALRILDGPENDDDTGGVEA